MAAAAGTAQPHRATMAILTIAVLTTAALTMAGAARLRHAASSAARAGTRAAAAAQARAVRRERGGGGGSSSDGDGGVAVCIAYGDQRRFGASVELEAHDLAVDEIEIELWDGARSRYTPLAWQ
eukprot:scaffold20278_cov57-Phaeocystis_antarctica.AAC.1